MSDLNETLTLRQTKPLSNNSPPMCPFDRVPIYPVLLDLPDFMDDPPHPFPGQEGVAVAAACVSLCFSFSSYFQFLVKID